MYGLTSLQEVKVTADFLQLDMKYRNCQNKESFEDCTSRKYLEKVQQECNCIPYRLIDFENKDKVMIFMKKEEKVCTFVAGVLYINWK